MSRLRAFFARFRPPDRTRESQAIQNTLLDMERRNRSLQEENFALLRQQEQEYAKAQVVERRSEMVEALAMYGAGPWQATGVTVNAEGAVSEAAGTPAVLVKLKERFWELELALEDRGWQRQLAMANTEFSRYGIQQIILICRLYFIKNPLVRRGVELCADYVFGRGFQITSDDEDANTFIEQFLKANAKQLGTSALLQKERTLRTDGNLFWAFFTDQSTGEMMVQTIDAAEIEDIVCDPDNADVEWFFKRRYMQTTFDPELGTMHPQQKVCWYVALGYETKLNGFGTEQDPIIRQDGGEPVYVYHRKVGGIEKVEVWLPRSLPHD